MFGLAIADVFIGYPEDVVRRVTAPGTGLASRLKWVPSIAEVRDACEAEMEPRRREAARTARLAIPDEVDRSPRKSLAELQAECERRGGMIPRGRRGSPVPKPLSPEAAEKLLADLAERAKQSSGIKASPELLANLEERACLDQ